MYGDRRAPTAASVLQRASLCRPLAGRRRARRQETAFRAAMERSSFDGLLHSSSSDERPDFVLTLTDVSSSLRSRARRLITSVATLGLLRAQRRKMTI